MSSTGILPFMATYLHFICSHSSALIPSPSPQSQLLLDDTTSLRVVSLHYVWVLEIIIESRCLLIIKNIFPQNPLAVKLPRTYLHIYLLFILIDILEQYCITLGQIVSSGILLIVWCVTYFCCFDFGGFKKKCYYLISRALVWLAICIAGSRIWGCNDYHTL